MYRCSCGWTGDKPLVIGDTTKWYGCPKCLKPLPDDAGDDAVIDWLMNAMGMKK